MEQEHDYTGFAIENILHPIILAIKESQYPSKKEENMIKQALEEFLKEAKNYQECPGFQDMTVEQLQAEYERLMGKQNQEER